MVTLHNIPETLTLHIILQELRREQNTYPDQNLSELNSMRDLLNSRAALTDKN